MESNSVCNLTSDNKIGRPRSGSPTCFITSMITGRIGRHEVLLPINHKNHNFREKKNSQVMEDREKLHYNTHKGDVNILRAPHLLPVIGRQKHKSKRVHARTHVITTLNVIG